MNVKLAVVFLFALVAVSHAGYTILNTYSDDNCTSTNIIASFATNDPSACGDKKRAIEQNSFCASNAGIVFEVDLSFCSDPTNDTVPTWPADWQVVQFSTDSTCNSSFVSTYFLAAPMNNFGPTTIAFFSSGLTGGFAPINATMVCNTTSGQLYTSACMMISNAYICLEFNMAPNTCTDAGNSYFGYQSTCVAAPVAEPVAAPVASSPVAVPTTSTTPVKAPVAKSSSASIVYSSVALLSIVAML